MSNPERLVPHHLGGEIEEEKLKEESPPEEEPAKEEGEQVTEEPKEEKTGHEMYEERQEALRKSEDLDGILRKEWKEKYGKEAPKGINLALRTIEAFRRDVKEAQDLRKVIRYGKDAAEKKASKKADKGAKRKK